QVGVRVRSGSETIRADMGVRPLRPHAKDWRVFCHEMRNRSLPFVAVIVVGLASFCRGADQAKALVHPGMLQSRADLDFMKAKVLAGEQPWKGAWDRMCAASYSSLKFEPKAFEHVIRGA